MSEKLAEGIIANTGSDGAYELEAYDGAIPEYKDPPPQEVLDELGREFTAIHDNHIIYQLKAKEEKAVGGNTIILPNQKKFNTWRGIIVASGCEAHFCKVGDPVCWKGHAGYDYHTSGKYKVKLWIIPETEILAIIGQVDRRLTPRPNR